MELIYSGGIVLFVIILISIFAVYLFFTRLFKLAKEPMDADSLMERVNSAVLERDLDKALEIIDYPALRKEQAELRKQGRYLGIGLASYVEICGFGDRESDHSNRQPARVSDHRILPEIAPLTPEFLSHLIRTMRGVISCGKGRKHGSRIGI